MRHLKFGLLVWRENEATAGYTLFSPLHDSSTYLIDLRGDVVHKWDHPLTNSTYAYLLENGNLLWAGQLQRTNVSGRMIVIAAFVNLARPRTVAKEGSADAGA